MLLDLHTHSTASDGQYTPEELARMVKEKEIALWALTDHDTVAGVPQAREAAKGYGLPFVSGIEISTRRGVEIHILGYGIDEQHPQLLKSCQNYQQERLSRGQRICDYLVTRGVEIKLEEALEEAAGTSLVRPHFAKVMVKKGYVKTVSEAFERYLETYQFHQVTDGKLPDPADAISTIHACGGIAVLAHPGQIKLGNRGRDELIHELIESGLDGIEVYHSGHEYAQKKHFYELALEQQMIITAGSDFHGEKLKPSVKLGMKVEEKKLRYCEGYERINKR